MKHPVFVPQTDSFAFKSIAKGSAILGKECEGLGYIVYYEGNIFGAENIKTFEDKAMLAAGRMEENYPTIAKMLCETKELILVGHFESGDNSFTALHDSDATRALHSWLEGQ